jgi:Icc-related predicted phosphoesterase
MSGKSLSKTTSINKMRILLLSDLHSTDNIDFRKDSHLFFEDGSSQFAEAFLNYTEELPFVDYVVCSGDISNKSCKKGFEHGWKFLNSIVDKTKAKGLFCVPGNHDHKSRAESGVFSPKHDLQFIVPPFPHPDHKSNTHFWAWNWSLIQEESFNVILVNTSAYHGYGDQEYKMGRIAHETVEHIRSQLKSISPKKFNILICHHHPMPMTNVDRSSDNENIDGGVHLLECLEKANIGPWLVLHGHKHYAQIKLGSTSFGSPPVILSAGSFSAKLYDEIKTRTSNQFYILEIDLTKTEQSQKMVGNFYTHECIAGVWRKSRSNNLPSEGGFGADKNPAQILSDIKRELNQLPFISSESIPEIIENIKNLMPDSLNRLKELLEKEGLSVIEDRNEIVQIGKKIC